MPHLFFLMSHTSRGYSLSTPCPWNGVLCMFTFIVLFFTDLLFRDNVMELHRSVDILKSPGLGPGPSFACRYLDINVKLLTSRLPWYMITCVSGKYMQSRPYTSSCGGNLCWRMDAVLLPYIFHWLSCCWWWLLYPSTGVYISQGMCKFVFMCTEKSAPGSFTACSPAKANFFSTLNGRKMYYSAQYGERCTVVSGM